MFGRYIYASRVRWDGLRGGCPRACGGMASEVAALAPWPPTAACDGGVRAWQALLISKSGARGAVRSGMPVLVNREMVEKQLDKRRKDEGR